MALSVLGPLRLDGPDGPVALSGRKTRALLTALALAAPRPLTIDALCDYLWDEPPSAAVKTVQAHLSRIRQALVLAQPRVGRLPFQAAGYQLVAEPGQLDVHVVADLRRLARIRSLAGDDDDAERLLAEARDCWRGLPELPSTRQGDVERARLDEDRLDLIEDHLAVSISAGRPAVAIGELDALTTRHPFRERLWELKITALYYCGRQADALAAYQKVRDVLIEELGVEPGPALRRLEKAVLEQDLPVSVTARGPRTAVARDTVTRTGPSYAATGGVHVAYTTFGDGPHDLLVLNPTFIPVDAYLEEPQIAAAMSTMSAGRRLIVFDRRGLGLSDPVTPDSPPTLPQWVDDAVAVLDALGVARVDVLANADTSLIGLALAARHPHRVAALTLVNGYARFTAAPDYPHGRPTREISGILHSIHTPQIAPVVDVVAWRLPTAAADPRFRAWWDAVGRRGASPRTATLVHDLIVGADVRPVLRDVTVPVLLLCRLGCASYDPGHSRYLAAHLPCATVAERNDPNDPWFIGDVQWISDQQRAFAAAPRNQTS